jgi:hypothetical protein
LWDVWHRWVRSASVATDTAVATEDTLGKLE